MSCEQFGSCNLTNSKAQNLQQNSLTYETWFTPVQIIDNWLTIYDVLIEFIWHNFYLTQGTVAKFPEKIKHYKELILKNMVKRNWRHHHKGVYKLSRQNRPNINNYLIMTCYEESKILFCIYAMRYSQL